MSWRIMRQPEHQEARGEISLRALPKAKKNTKREVSVR
jgi:hypothetical protein